MITVATICLILGALWPKDKTGWLLIGAGVAALCFKFLP